MMCHTLDTLVTMGKSLARKGLVIMTVKTFLEIETADHQGYVEIFKIRIINSAFGTGIPAAAKIEAVAASLFGASKLSTQIVQKYRVVVEQDTPSTAGGDGSVATATAVRFRNDLTTLDWPLSVPGLNKANVSFDPTNPNSIQVTGSMFDDIRDALTDAAIAFADPTPTAYAATTVDNALSVGTAFQGRRAPKRTR